MTAPFLLPENINAIMLLLWQCLFHVQIGEDMPKNTFTIKKGVGQKVEIEWRGYFKDVSVRFEGQEIGYRRCYWDTPTAVLFQV